ncbi:MAG: Flp pilus assembly complex ATPase component TadA [Candidatus Rokubacteria bacterium]|nr:Flp pilus assembly complex ATPase component TadA [Candidatus Rokubacteria bacterium]
MTEAPAETDVTGVAQVYALLLGALREGATEIHVEPLQRDIRVRNRVEGRLVERARLPRNLLGPVTSRFRVLAGLRSESLPMQAQIRTRLEGQEIELELLFFPTLQGEAITVRIWQRALEVPTLDGLELEPQTREALRGMLDGRGGLVLATGGDLRARATVLYALAQAATAPGKKTVTVERVVSFVIPDFLQVEVPGDFAEAAATILASPADVVLVEDLGRTPACLAAIGGAEQGMLVLGGLGFATTTTGLAHLLGLDLPRGPLLGITRGLVNVQRHGGRYRVEAVPMTEELRRELFNRQAPWTSRIS